MASAQTDASLETSMYTTACQTLDVMEVTAYQTFIPVDYNEGRDPMECTYYECYDKTGRTFEERAACYSAYLAKTDMKPS